MNKKGLSVVMAGAMLATSVAPVLAAETTGTEIANNQLKAFKKQILAKMAEKKISDFTIFKTAGFVSSDIATEISNNDATGEFSSAYGIKITDKNGVVKLDTTYTTDAGTLETNLDKLVEGDKVEVYERETTDFGGQLLPGSGIESISKPEAYNKTTDPFGTTNIANVRNEIAITNSEIVKTAGTNITATGTPKVLTVKTEKTTTSTGSEKVELTFNETDNRVDGKLAYDADGKLLDVTKVSSVQKFDHFGDLVKWESCAEAPDKKAKVVETYTIGAEEADPTRETVKASDLFDGIALTSKGTEIINDINNAREDFKENGGSASNNEAELVRINLISSGDLGTDGLARFQVAYYKNATSADENDVTKAEKLITVVSDSSEELKGLYNLLNSGEFNVGVVAGENRYETAVNVAKAQKIIALDGTANKDSIVLVNGKSLVDGLAAAPLASEKSAPLLLAETDKLPTATREYIESLVSEVGATSKKKVTVYLVGGKAVLSNSLVNEIEEIGLKVERVGGENREATSVAVASLISNPTKAFVVGATGEADAMSISAVAANKEINETGNKVTPIIVSKMGGLSADAVDFLREKTNINDITILGGEKVVSKAEEEKINKALTGVKATRLAGENRFETNSAIVEKYYAQIGTTTTNANTNKGVEGVIVVKDGVSRKDELVDALSAANYAASLNAPVVLASQELKETQKKALLTVDTEKYDTNEQKTVNSMKKAIQVGNNSARTLLESVAKFLNVSNKVK